MKITVFTSNKLRHISLINLLSEISEKVFAVIEEKPKRKNLHEYFRFVKLAENQSFKNNEIKNKNIEVINLRKSSINELKRNNIYRALKSDYYIVFGTSIIKGWLLEELIDNKALNVHLGVSPYYRGSACNFWSIYENNPHFTGASIQKLSSKVDDGEILYHAIPDIQKCNNTFDFSMRAVLAAQKTLVNKLKTKSIHKISLIPNDNKKIIRVCWRKDFNEKVANLFLKQNNFDKIKKLYFKKFEKRLFHNIEIH